MATLLTDIVAPSSVVILNGTQTLTNKTLSTGSLWNGTVIGVAYGGLGQSTLPTAGQIPIGNSSNGFTLNTLTAGDYIGITNANGQVTIAYTGTVGGSSVFTAQARSDLGNVFDVASGAGEDLGLVTQAVTLNFDMGALQVDGIVSLSNLDSSVRADYLSYSLIFGF